MKIKIEIKNRRTGKILFEFEKENNTIKDTVMEAIRTRADLTDADLTRADLTDADLTRADLTPIREDLFMVLLRAIPEIPNLKKSIIEGKIDGSCYEGECCCLNGTLAKGATNGMLEQIYAVRNSSRPIERYFMGIKKGDTPETSQFSKIALGWIEEFESFLPTPSHRG